MSGGGGGRAEPPPPPHTQSHHALRYFNYALEHHPTSIRLKQLLFANGPMPGMTYNTGDEGSMGQPTWSRHSKTGFTQQLAFDHKAGFDYVGYHSYAKRRYYDVSLQ